MKAIGIASDSTCDLSQEFKEKYDISVLPLCIHLGDEEYHDNVDIGLDDIFAWSDAHRLTPKTSAFSPADAERFLKERMEECEDLIIFTISAPMSSSNNILQIVAEEMGIEERVHVVDSENLSVGVGLLAVRASIMAREGASVDEILKEMKRMIPKIRVSFVIDTMDYLYRGGRCGGMTALVAGTLKLHPSIFVENGAMRVGKKYRGKMDKVVKNFYEDMLGSIKRGQKDRLVIAHANCSEEILSSVKESIESLHHYDEVCIMSVGGVVACHCGPGTLGIVFEEE